MARRKKRGPYWKEPVVIGSVALSIVLLVATGAAILHFGKAPVRRVRDVVAAPRKEPPPIVEIDGREVNLDKLGVRAYADLLAEVVDEGETLDQIEHALTRGLQRGRQMAGIPTVAPLGNAVPAYPSRLRHRLKELIDLGSVKGTLWAGACMELGLYEYYRENRARAEESGDDVSACPFGDSYASLGLTGSPQGGYHAAVFFFGKAINGIDPNDKWGEMNMRCGAALANIALVLRAWGDQAGAVELLSEAQLIFQFLHSANNVAEMREYKEVLRSEAPPGHSPPSPVAAEIKARLRQAQNLP